MVQADTHMLVQRQMPEQQPEQEPEPEQEQGELGFSSLVGLAVEIGFGVFVWVRERLWMRSDLRDVERAYLESLGR